jgi:hypothetical protein
MCGVRVQILFLVFMDLMRVETDLKTGLVHQGFAWRAGSRGGEVFTSCFSQNDDARAG